MVCRGRLLTGIDRQQVQPAARLPSSSIIMEKLTAKIFHCPSHNLSNLFSRSDRQRNTRSGLVSNSKQVPESETETETHCNKEKLTSGMSEMTTTTTTNHNEPAIKTVKFLPQILEIRPSASTASSQECSDETFANCISDKFSVIDVLDKKPNKGAVFLVKKRCSQNSSKTVLKVFPRRDDRILAKRLREAEHHMLASISDHPHIAAYVNQHHFPTAFCIEVEHCARGDLTKLPSRTPQLERLDLVRQLASALQHLHSLSMIHVDIKPGNVALAPLSNGRLIAKLIDFGSARSSGKWRYQGVAFGATSHYKAPECFPYGPCREGKFMIGVALDMWGLGVIMICLLTGRMPWQMAQVQDFKYKSFFDHMKLRDVGSSAAIPINGLKRPLPLIFYEHLIPGMLNPYPDRRYSARRIEGLIIEFLQEREGAFEEVDGVAVYTTNGTKKHSQSKLLRLRKIFTV